MKAINFMTNLPKEITHKRDELIDFINVLEIAFLYSPDHQKGGLYQRKLEKAEEISGAIPELARDLEDIFFNSLYVELPQRKSIENYIKGTNNLIFLVGPVGIGKTVLTWKIKNNLEDKYDTKVVLINFRNDAYGLKSSKSDEIVSEVKELIFDLLYTQVLPNNKVEELFHYHILYDKAFRETRYEIDRRVGFKIGSVDEVEKALEDDEIKGLTEGIHPEDKLNSLIKFLLAEKTSFVIFLDNLDRLTFNKQLNIAIVCRELVERYGMPILLAIRSTNIRQVVKEMRKISGEEDYLGSVFYYETITPIFNKREKYYLIKPSDASDIRQMIKRRYNCLNEQKYYATLRKFKENFLSKHDMTSDEFDRKFLQVLERITYDFVDIGVYKYSNFNLREMFLQYLGFVITLLLNPEPDYLWDNILLTTGKVDHTKLKTYMIKWQIANGKIIPLESDNLINIFTPHKNSLSLLDLRILTYLYNKLIVHPNKNISIKAIYEDFFQMDVDRMLLEERLISLGTSRGSNHLGFLWLDTEEDGKIDNDTLIVLNPAGEYFLTDLTNKREYVFWAGITANLPINIVGGKKFKLDDTYRDEFKLKVVADLIKKVLIPNIGHDMQNHIVNINVPSNWPGNKFDYFLDTFARDNRFYVDHLISSVRGAVSRSVNIDRGKYNKIYSRLFSQLEKEIEISKKKYLGL